MKMKKRNKLQWLAFMLAAALMITFATPTVSARAMLEQVDPDEDLSVNTDFCGGSISGMFSVGKVGSKTYQTYTKTNAATGQVYSGRTSGTGSAAENVRVRDVNHHMNSKGYGPAILDKSSNSYEAIRGREQMLIEANGGAQSMGGTSGNAINGIGAGNPNGLNYRNAAQKEFERNE